MANQLYGMTKRRHEVFVAFYSVLLLLFIALGVVSVFVADYTPGQWAVAGFLILTTALSLVWEIHVVRLFRRRHKSVDEPGESPKGSE
ncbi:MAG: hypothetical protein PIR02_12535 [Microbacterium enclense]